MKRSNLEKQALCTVAEAAWCFLVTALVSIGSLVLICYGIDWLKGSAQ